MSRRDVRPEDLPELFIRPDRREDERRAALICERAASFVREIVVANLRSELRDASSDALAHEATDFLELMLGRTEGLAELRDHDDVRKALRLVEVDPEADGILDEFADRTAVALCREFVGRWTNVIERHLVPTGRATAQERRRSGLAFLDKRMLPIETGEGSQERGRPFARNFEVYPVQPDDIEHLLELLRPECDDRLELPSDISVKSVSKSRDVHLACKGIDPSRITVRRKTFGDDHAGADGCDYDAAAAREGATRVAQVRVGDIEWTAFAMTG